MKWEVVLSDGASLFPESDETLWSAISYVEMLLEMEGDNRKIVGIRPADSVELARVTLPCPARS